MVNKNLEFNCLTTGIGSMPHADARDACLLINRHVSLPFWPQLPRRTGLENMYVQYSEGFPGIKVADDTLHVERGSAFDRGLEKLYQDSEEGNFKDYRVSADYAAGLHAFTDIISRPAQIVKGQITGPVSWGLAVRDIEDRGIVYDELLAETVARFLRLKAIWQESLLKTVSPNTVIFVDEPYLASLGSAFVAISGEKVSQLMEDVLAGIQGTKGIHCCGSTDWSLLLKSSADVLSFDAYNYADSLSTYVQDVEAFINRGSAIAWGIVPNEEEFLMKESVSSLFDRLGEAIAPYTENGISFKQIIAQSLLTPSCGLASLSLDAATNALEALNKLSDKIKRKYT